MTQNNELLGKAFRAWVPLAVTIIIFGGFVFAAVQYNFRQTADDQQIQLAEDIAQALSSGNVPPETVVPADPTTDIKTSLSPLVVIFSATGTPIGSSVSVGGKLPTLPSSVFDAVSKKSQDRITWQAEAGTRVAAVVQKFEGPTPGYVLAGKSLREVDKRVQMLTIMSATATAVALLLSFLAFYFVLKQQQPSGQMAEEKQEERPTPQQNGTV